MIDQMHDDMDVVMVKLVSDVLTTGNDSMEANTRKPRETINCDTVSHLTNALQQLTKQLVRATYEQQNAAQVACLLEIMDTLNLGFEDEAAMNNAVSGLRLQARMGK